MQAGSNPMDGGPSVILTGDCLDRMREIPDNTIDAIVTDPPYGLSFMGARWDYDVPSPEYWTEALRVSKPGAHLLCFGGTRTFHRMACAIEDAGWEIRDTIMWVYGSGFPKSMDVSKAIDKELGAEREKVPNPLAKQQTPAIGTNTYGEYGGAAYAQPKPATEQAREWDGWGTALKPAWEPIIVARKPLDGTVAHNVMTYGTGAINIDACRVGTETMTNRPAGNKAGGNSLNMSRYGMPQDAEPTTATGRFPANLVHDGSDDATDLLGGAARFFYCAKASKRDRGEGNFHPTVKPTALMQWLVRLVCKQGGIVLDPFCGSGSTGVACIRDGMRFLGIEKDPHYAEIAGRRISVEPLTVFMEEQP